MSAEEIARVVKDIRHGRVYDVDKHLMVIEEDGELTAARARAKETRERVVSDLIKLSYIAPIVDSTAIYKQYMLSEGCDIYACRAAPPWQNALITYVNQYGNVHVMHLTSIDIEDYDDDEDPDPFGKWDVDDQEHGIEWDRVRWVVNTVLFMGGHRSNGDAVATMGPLHIWRLAVYPDGEIADIHWVRTRPDVDSGIFDTALSILLMTLDMCNCVNVQVVEPDRPRAAQRRLNRTGVTVSEIHIRPVSRSYRGKGTPFSHYEDMPLSSVRGHFNHYGPQYGKGLLFGKYAGRFWIPQHVRGAAEYGVVEQEYVAEP